MNDYPYRITNWTEILILLQRSLYAEQMVCSMSSQLFHIPKTQNLKGNKEMHSHLINASYHRVTAVGSAHRLNNGESHQSIIDTLLACIENAQKSDVAVSKGLNVMLEHSQQDVKPFIQTIIQWQNEAETYLEQAKTALP